VVEGTVISVDKKEVIVNIGYKSDGIIPASEFRYNPELKVGDKVEITMTISFLKLQAALPTMIITGLKF
jgi:ribosomal protein S1